MLFMIYNQKVMDYVLKKNEIRVLFLIFKYSPHLFQFQEKWLPQNK